MKSFDVVIIGGGALGGAAAFYLAKRGVEKVLLLERNHLAQANSSLAAGLLTRGRFKPHLIPLVTETYQAIHALEAVTGNSLNIRQTGCLYAAVSPEQQKAIRELANTSRQAGLKVEGIDLTAAAELVPWLKLPRDTSVIFMPEDAYIDGYTLASGYIKAAGAFGAEIREQTPVLSIRRDGNRITGVRTSKGEISAGLVIDAAGVWAGRLAHEIGVHLPMAPVRSHYWITSPDPAFSPSQPFVLLPDARAYARPETNRLLFGFREKSSVSVAPHKLPAKMDGFLFEKDPKGWDALLEGMPDFGKFVPCAQGIGIKNYVQGLSNYTPDGNFVLGELPPLDGFLAATGCAGAGIAMSGGIGRLVSDLVTGCPTFADSTPHRIDRFGSIDPFDPAFIQQCADARSGKITG